MKTAHFRKRLPKCERQPARRSAGRVGVCITRLTVSSEPSREQRSPFLEAALQSARECLVPVRYEYLGCEVCYPAIAVDAITRATGELTGEICPAERIDQRQGWPPLPGAYTVVRYRSAVAVCILTDDALAEAVLHEAPSEVGIVGTLQTEHLGIERLILNVLANPNIRL